MQTWYRKVLIFFVASFLICDFAFAQTPEKSDSLKLYRDIERFSKKRKATRFIYRLFFKPVDVPKEQKTKNEIKNIQPAYKNYEGKIIRKIQITSFDPFGYSASDTLVAKQNFLYVIGNKAHV